MLNIGDKVTVRSANPSLDGASGTVADYYRGEYSVSLDEEWNGYRSLWFMPCDIETHIRCPFNV